MSIAPFADQGHRFDSRYPGRYVSGPWRGVLHTTETTGLPGYGGGSTAPQLTVDPRRRRTWQHFDTALPGRALRHPPGTVETNNLHCVQIEIVAYSDEKIARQVGGVPVSELTAADLAYIASVMRWVEREHGIQATDHGLTWVRYPGTYRRMSERTWREFNGWCGHQHVPNNTHGDPSNINIGALLAGDDDVNLSDKVNNVWVPPAKPGAPATFTDDVTVNEVLRRASRNFWLGVEFRDKINTLTEAVAANAATNAAIMASLQGLDAAGIQDAVNKAVAGLKIVLTPEQPQSDPDAG